MPIYSEPQLARIRDLNDEFRRSRSVHDIAWLSALENADLSVRESVAEIIRGYEIFLPEASDPIQKSFGRFEFQGEIRNWEIGHLSLKYPEPKHLPRYDLSKVTKVMTVYDVPKKWQKG